MLLAGSNFARKGAGWLRRNGETELSCRKTILKPEKGQRSSPAARIGNRGISPSWGMFCDFGVRNITQAGKLK